MPSTPSAALLHVKMNLITWLRDQTCRGCLQSPSTCSNTSCSLPYPNLLFPHRETHSKGFSFLISTQRISKWKEHDAIQRIRGHVKNVALLQARLDMFQTPGDLTPDSAFLPGLQQLILLL